MITKTVIEILNSSLSKIAEIKNPYPINQAGYILRYSRELSDFGQCVFRVSTKDPVLTQFGDVLKPHAYHVRIKRGGTVVWQGAIVDNPQRTKNYIEIKALEYLFYFSKVLIRRDADNPTTTDDESNFRVFNSGTMSSAVTTIFDNAVSDFSGSHALAAATVGTVENPDYPDNFIDHNNVQLTGAWSFSSDVTLQFDYHSALYVLKTLGIYAKADFELTNALVFNFKKLIGQRISGITFKYGSVGTNIVDYNVPRFGQRQVNDIYGIAADDNGNILHANKRDTDSVATYGLLQDAEAYSDVKSRNILTSRISEKLFLVKDPEESPLNIVLDETAYPGLYGLGDIVWVKIQDHIIDFQKERRIIGYTVNLHNTGREMTVVQTNTPNPKLIGAS